MSIVEPIRNKKDIYRVEKILSEQSQRDLLLFTIGTNCGLRISDILRLNVADLKEEKVRSRCFYLIGGID